MSARPATKLAKLLKMSFGDYRAPFWMALAVFAWHVELFAEWKVVKGVSFLIMLMALSATACCVVYPIWEAVLYRLTRERDKEQDDIETRYRKVKRWWWI
jgi:hypothetical protein